MKQLKNVTSKRISKGPENNVAYLFVCIQLCKEADKKNMLE